MMFMLIRRSVICVVMLVGLMSCSSDSDTAKEVPTDSEGTYFSVRQFAADQFKIYRGTPFVIEKLVTLNGAEDSLMINSYEADWESIFQTFFATDIGDKKFLDQYQPEVFQDGMGAIVFYYTAKDDKLFTRSLQVRIDELTHRVLSVFVETGKKSFWSEERQKLYYTPMKLIQIQEYSKPLIGREKDLRVVWRFVL